MCCKERAFDKAEVPPLVILLSLSHDEFSVRERTHDSSNGPIKLLRGSEAAMSISGLVTPERSRVRADPDWHLLTEFRDTGLQRFKTRITRARNPTTHERAVNKTRFKGEDPIAPLYLRRPH